MALRSFLTFAVFSSAAAADYVCPASLTQTDAKAIAYGYTIQGLLEAYYNSVPVNASYFSALPMASETASNGQTMAENTVTNVEGLDKQAMLGSMALMDMGKMLGLSPPTCDYQLPIPMNATEHLMNAFMMEASLCGAFIGLADYIQSPVLNSLSARLAAEHGIHASALRANMQPVGFMPNNTMLTPAFTPMFVLESGDMTGMLGQYLGGCLDQYVPSAPCGGTVEFGPLNSTLSGTTKTGAGMGMGGGYSNVTNGSVVGTAAPAQFTGVGSSSASRSMMGVAAMGFASMLLLS